MAIDAPLFRECTFRVLHSGSMCMGVEVKVHAHRHASFTNCSLSREWGFCWCVICFYGVFVMRRQGFSESGVSPFSE